MDKLSFSVAEMEAPLDLVLQLIAKHKLNILDIDISSLLGQYLAVIEQWKEQDLEVASEFLEMASRLVYMKTASLLPRHEEEAEALRRELTGQLVDYGICRATARNLGRMHIGDAIFVRKAMELPIDRTYTLIHPAGLLAAALSDAMGKNARRRPPPRDAFEPIVSRPVVSVTAKIFMVLRALRLSGHARLDKLYYAAGREKSSVIATFLALLELVRSGKVAIQGEEVGLVKKNR